MTKPNSTEIIFVVDRSGSMSSIAKAMSDGFDEFINKQKALPGECKVTAAQFDDQYEVLYTAKPLNEVPGYELVPRGMTALLDAVGKTIIDTGNRLAKLEEPERPSQVLFVVVTDGGENSSKEFRGEAGRKRVFDMITEQRQKYSWEFVFLGANQDSIATATGLGISASNAVTFDPTIGGSMGLMRGLSNSVANYRSSGEGTMENLYNQASYDATLGGTGGGDKDAE